MLARVNGYYSPYTPHTIMEEEEKAKYGDVFSVAEQEFFRYRLVSMYQKIYAKGIDSAIGFLEKQKLVNCPYVVHTEQRGYDCIVFRRQPDRKLNGD